MTKKQSTIRTCREPELQHMMFHANMGIIIGLAPMTLYLCQTFLGYDLSLITDITFLYLGMLCLLLSFSTRYLIHELEHITELHYNSKRYNQTEKGVDHMPSSEDSRIQ